MRSSVSDMGRCTKTSQLLTLYTTPVVYVALDRLRGRLQRWAPWRRHPSGGPKPALQGDF